jgi:hypothetical protein
MTPEQIKQSAAKILARRGLTPIPDQAPEEETKKNSRSEQARINGSHSRGPVSAAGKLKCSRGALKHGLTASKHTVLDIEDPEEFQFALDAAMEQFQPNTQFTVRLVEKLAHLDWRLERIHIIETAFLNYQISERAEIEDAPGTPNEVKVLLQAWLDSVEEPVKALELLRRYGASLETQYNRTLANLRTFLKMDATTRKPQQKPTLLPTKQSQAPTPEILPVPVEKAA